MFHFGSKQDNRQAQIRYLDGDYTIVSPGDYVVCAMTKQRILLAELRYWSVEHQEAYVNAQASHEGHVKHKEQEQTKA